MTVRTKSEDGQTAYQRVRMRPFTTRLLGFAEVCRYKIDPKEVQKNATMAARWTTGVFIGMCKMTGRYLVWNDVSVIAARSILRMPDVQKWNKDRVDAIAMRPYQLHKPVEPRVIFKEAADEIPQEAADTLRLIRRLYIKKSDIEAFGYTEGCVKCDHDMKYGFGRTTKGHSDQCRKRITEELAKTPAGMERIMAASGRAERFLTEYHEKGLGDDNPAQEESDAVRQNVEPISENLPAFEPIDAAEMGEPQTMGEHDAPNMDMDLIDGTQKHFANVSCMGSAPVTDEVSRRVEQDQQAPRHPVKPKHRARSLKAKQRTANNDVDVLKIGQYAEDWTVEEREEISALQREILQLTGTIGCDQDQYIAQVNSEPSVAEVYSAPRVTKAAKLLPKYGIAPGYALDLSTVDERGIPWDFDDPEMREKAKKRQRDEQPMLLVGSPMCT